MALCLILRIQKNYSKNKNIGQTYLKKNVWIKQFQWNTVAWLNQFVIFNPWKVPWNRIAFYQNYFVMSPGLLYHLIRCDAGSLANEVFTSNPIVSSKQ